MTSEALFKWFVVSVSVVMININAYSQVEIGVVALAGKTVKDIISDIIIQF